MVTLPTLDDYDSVALAFLSERSPAFARYRGLLATANLDPLLRLRHEAWCRCAAATLLDRAPTVDVCAFWSDVADRILSTAWHDAGFTDLPAALIAMGKHGARELNLSSDVDLMIVCEPDAVAHATRALRQFQTRLAGGEHGFYFRLDFDLRPGGRGGPLLTTPRQFEAHYWNLGETWERLAMVRLRPVVGNDELMRTIEDLTERFSYRKFLDYTLLDDLKHLRARVHRRGFTRRDSETHLKLEVGGIRDVELFTHAQLILHGGKRPALRTRGTGDALNRLAAAGLLDAEVATTLARSYWFLRAVENGVQAIDDRQTHVLPDADPAAPAVRACLAEVDRIVSSLLGPVDLRDDQVDDRLPLSPTEQSAWLTELGFGDASVFETWPRLMRATALSQKSERDERARREVLRAFVTALAATTDGDRDLGLSILTDFVRATRTKATFYSTLLRVPDLIRDLARLFSRSPYSGAILAARPELLDQMIAPAEQAWSPDHATLLAQMSERRLLTELWAVNHLLAEGAAVDVFARVSSVADQIATELLRQLHVEYPAARVAVLTLGKWGGRELGLRSDLDFIFLTDHSPTPDDTRVARRFVTRLTNPGRTGALYDVDLRLRPSGQSGPLMVTRDRLREYWRTDAAAWERQAYLRARPLASADTFDRAGLTARPVTPADLLALRRIREGLLITADDPKFGPKHAPGGLIDIEFVAQTALLAARLDDAPTDTCGMITHLAARDPRWAKHASELISEYAGLRAAEQLAYVTNQTPDRADVLARTRRARVLLNELDPTGLIYPV